MQDRHPGDIDDCPSRVSEKLSVAKSDLTLRLRSSERIDRLGYESRFGEARVDGDEDFSSASIEVLGARGTLYK